MKWLIVLLALCPLEALPVTTTHRARQRGLVRRTWPRPPPSPQLTTTTTDCDSSFKLGFSSLGTRRRHGYGGGFLGYERRTDSVIALATSASSSSTSSSDSVTDLTGIPSLKEAERLKDWLLNQNPVAKVDQFLEIAVFESVLRGIKWTGPLFNPGDAPRVVASIPASRILRSQHSSPTWDAQLALQIWDEYRKGKESAYYPYVQLLASGQPYTKGMSYCPEPLAPHAIRHWTEDQLSPLLDTAAGRRVLDLHAQQDTLWRQKYETLIATSMTEDENPPLRSQFRERMSWEQFQWAMEAVHSRAYVGASMEIESPLLLAASLAPTIAVAIMGILYSTLADFDLPLPLLRALALGAALPLVASLGAPSHQSAAMLPLIDLANHRPGADSEIRFDPITNSFELAIGPLRCVDESSRQLFVSYGDKSDTELLLNYGIVPDSGTATPGSRQGSSKTVDLNGDGESYQGAGDRATTNDTLRRRLAAKFNARNG